MFFASVLGVFFSFLLLFVFAVLSVVAIVNFAGSELKKTPKDSPILKIDISGIITEREYYDPLNLIFRNYDINSQGLNDILDAIAIAKDDSKIKGIYLRTGLVQAGVSAMEDVRNALLDFKQSGKFVVAYGEIISQRAYFAASAADKIFLNPQGMLELKGLGSMQQYNKGVFEKMGIEMQVFKVGKYKSYIEPYISDKMSDEDREQKSAYLNSIWNIMIAGIGESRGISADLVNEYADEYTLFSAPENLVKYGLIDSLVYADEVETYLKNLTLIEDDKDLKFAKPTDVIAGNFELPSGAAVRNKIAVLYAEGSIVSDAEDNMFSGTSISAKNFTKELKKLQGDSSVKAVVFRVNSGGGSAFASDQIWHSVRELGKVKPVVASLGSYAASGGYYIVCGANKIVTSPSTLTGSIGIFGLFPSGKQLADKLGATYDGVATNKRTLFGEQALTIPFLNAGVLPARPLDEDELALLQGFVERGYDAFLSRCKEGRDVAGQSISKDSLNEIGQGRVWTGTDAVRLGLADTLGNLETAIAVAAKMANLEEYSVDEYPTIKDPTAKFFEEVFGSSKIHFLEFVLGKDNFEKRRLLNALAKYDYRQAVIDWR
ncbi:signal peptide peptidase SppA [Fibrobacterales bacterium]|nr:signal peptide peptidase SppA [Fibrobacterales bacterium]